MASHLRKAKDWILETGYPLEFEVIDLLGAHDWEVMASTNYFDEDCQKWRELDVKAYKGLDFGEARYTPGWPYRLTLTLVIQCKRSQKYAWVYFPLAATSKEKLRLEHIDFLKVARVQSLASGDTRAFQSHRILGVSRSILMDPPLVKPSVARKIKWLTEIVAFGAADFQSLAPKIISSVGTVAPLGGEGRGRDEVLEEASTLSKALVYELELTSNVTKAVISLLLQGYEPHPDQAKPSLSINIPLPIIVFDGPLCLWQGKDSDLKKVDCLIYVFHCRSSNYFGRRTIIVVKKDSFELLLKGFNNDLVNLAQKFEDRKSDLDNQMKLIMESKGSRT